MSNRRFIGLLAGIMVLCLAVTGLLWLNRKPGTQVVVTVNGKEQAGFSLYTDRTVIIGPEDGSWHNTLVIENGTARVVESDCENQVCVMMPALSEDTIGMIVCLPHGLTVELRQQ